MTPGVGRSSTPHPPCAVSGNGTYNSPAPQFVPTAPGNYHWVAVYSGNSPNTNGVTHNAACTDTNEDVTVNYRRLVDDDRAALGAKGLGDDQRASRRRTSPARCRSSCTPSSDCSGHAPSTAPRGPSPGHPRRRCPPLDAATQPAAQGSSGNYSWRVGYDSTNTAQRDIPASCHETSALTIDNGGTISSP